MHPLVDDFILAQTPENQDILTYIRQIILSGSPKIQEKYSFNTPFYYYYGMLVYLTVKPEGVNLGFCKGYLMDTRNGVLEMKDRKQVATIFFRDIEQVQQHEELLHELIQEALLLNELAQQQKTTKKKTK